MYCPINEPEIRENNCPNGCCRSYSTALAFIGGIVLFVIGLILGTVLFDVLLEALPVLIAAAAVLVIIFIVTALTKNCCKRSVE